MFSCVTNLEIFEAKVTFNSSVGPGVFSEVDRFPEHCRQRFRLSSGISGLEVRQSHFPIEAC